MSFQEHAIKTEYRSLIDNVVQKFYVPLLKEAVSYKRAVGFFSSSSLIEISKGIADLASRGGRIQIVASPYLSDDDIEAIKKGYADRDEVIEAALLGQLSDEHADYYSMERLNLLANLIANGVLDIRIAYTEDAKGIGMYHEKMGIIEDADGNKVAFSGSMNESSKDGDDLQAIVAIKCLDEGVNIPGIRTAFILASTTNPKEYIQRRGRVLRKSPETGKEFAEIFDFVTLPRPLDEVSGLTQEQMRRDLSLVKNELARVLEFGRLSMNSMEASQLIWEICDCYGLPYDLNDDEKEDP